MVQESVMVDLSDMDARKRRKFNGLDGADEEDYMNQVKCLKLSFQIIIPARVMKDTKEYTSTG